MVSAEPETSRDTMDEDIDVAAAPAAMDQLRFSFRQHPEADIAEHGEDLGDVLVTPDKRPEIQDIYMKDTINWWAEIKNDPLFPFWYYTYHFTMPGFGLLTEGYVIFSNGNNKTLFRQTYPPCWVTYTTCNQSWVESVDYLQIVGILCGQVILGALADVIGRRKVWILNAVIMSLGVALIIGSTGHVIGENLWVILYGWAFFVYGFGVGGEYPVSASVAAEKSSSAKTAKQRANRGRHVTLTFTNQGWGQWINVVVLIALMLLVNGGSGNGPYTPQVTDAIWRTAYALVLPFIVYLTYWRVWRVKEDKGFLKMKKAMDAQMTPQMKWNRKKLLITKYGPRLIASMGGWFLNDVGFYGSKMFVGQIIGTIVGPHASVMTFWLWTWIQTSVQLVGYYLASMLMDKQWYGRWRMQMTGFLAMTIIYTTIAAAYPWMTGDGVDVYAFLFFFQAFWQQFGPNCTTFIIPVETFPTVVRATSHGMSAASGKFGALVAEVWSNYVSNRTKVIISAAGNLAGFILTFVFLPDPTGLELEENDRFFKLLEDGSVDQYHGEAVNPKHLSFFERFVLGWHKNYDPAADAVDKQMSVKYRVAVSMKESQMVDRTAVDEDEGDNEDFNEEEEDNEDFKTTFSRSETSSSGKLAEV